MHNEHTSYRIGYPIGYEMDRLDIQLGIQFDMKSALPGFRRFISLQISGSLY